MEMNKQQTQKKTFNISQTIEIQRKKENVRFIHDSFITTTPITTSATNIEL